MDYKNKYLKYKMKYLELRKDLINQGYDVDDLMKGEGLFSKSPTVTIIDKPYQKKDICGYLNLKPETDECTTFFDNFNFAMGHMNKNVGGNVDNLRNILIQANQNDPSAGLISLLLLLKSKFNKFNQCKGVEHEKQIVHILEQISENLKGVEFDRNITVKFTDMMSKDYGCPAPAPVAPQRRKRSPSPAPPRPDGRPGGRPKTPPPTPQRPVGRPGGSPQTPPSPTVPPKHSKPARKAPPPPSGPVAPPKKQDFDQLKLGEYNLFEEQVASYLKNTQSEQCSLLNKFFYPGNENACILHMEKVETGLRQFKQELKILITKLNKVNLQEEPEGQLDKIKSDQYNRTFVAFICLQKLKYNEINEENLEGFDINEELGEITKVIMREIKNLIISLYIGITLEEFNNFYDTSDKGYDGYNLVFVKNYDDPVVRSYVLGAYFTLIIDNQCGVLENPNDDKLTLILSYIKQYIIAPEHVVEVEQGGEITYFDELQNVTFNKELNEYTFDGPGDIGNRCPPNQQNKYSVDDMVLTDTPSM